MISAVLVVRNEEARIESCLQRLRPFVDEIVVLDQSSTDATADIAERFADVFLTDEAYGFCEASRGKAMEAASHDWVLLIDADEELVPGFDLRALRDRADCIYLRRKTFVDSVELEDMEHLRLFRRSVVVAQPILHILPKPNPGTTEWRCDELALVSYKSATEQLLDELRYATLAEK